MVHDYQTRMWLCCCVLSFSISCSAQSESRLPDSLKSYVERIFDTIQRHSLYRSKVDIDLVKMKFYKHVMGMSTRGDLANEFGNVLSQLGDYHGSFYFRNKAHGMPPKDVSVSDDLATGWKHGPRIRTKILDGRYGYLFLPSMISNQTMTREALARQVQDSVCTLNKQGIEGWIIDLRLNLGGDMWAMLGGLSDLLGTDTLGVFEEPDGNRIPWEIRNGNLYEGRRRTTDLQSRCKIRQPAKIVVLLSPVTASSAEATAISLKGLPNTVLIGEKTSGYTTAIEVFAIDKDTSILLSCALMTDSKGNYSEYISPDIPVINGDNFDDLDSDKKIRAALEWLDAKR